MESEETITGAADTGGAERDVGLAALDAIIDRLKAGRLRLPCLPDIALRVREAIADPDRSIADVSRLVQVDPALATRIVRIANSPIYRANHRIDNCHTAITRLGLEVTRNLVVSFTLRNLFTPASRALSQRLQTVWQHSCRVAAISSVLARLTPGVDPDRALLGGLVHDIGELPILEYLAQLPVEEADTMAGITPRIRGPLGTFILKSWQFNPDLAEIPRQAEQWDRPSDGAPDYVDIIQVAHAHAQFGSDDPYRGPPLPELPAFGKLTLSHLGPGSSMEVIAQSQQEINEVIALLQAAD